MKKNVVITVRVTEEERRELDRRCKGQSRVSYIRDALFGDTEISESGMTKAEEDNLKLTAASNLLLTYLTDTMGKKELIHQAKEKSEEWFKRKYIKKN